MQEPMHPDGRRGDALTADEWVERMAGAIAHLAAQLTISQLRLRALATALAEAGHVAPEAVQGGLAALAETEALAYLEQNLGESLIGIVDTTALAEEIVSFLGASR